MTMINPPIRRWLTAFAVACFTLAFAILAVGIVNGQEQVAGRWLFIPSQADPLPTFDPLKQPLVNIEWLGCVGDDPNVDNGPLLTKALARFGRDIEGIAFVPAKRFWCKSTITSGLGAGLSILGVAPADQARGDAAWANQPVSLISWNGEDGGTLYRIQRSSHHIEGVSFSGSKQPDNVFEPSATTLIEITQDGATWPVGNIWITRCTGTNAGKMIYCGPGSHADHIAARIMTHGVAIPYETNENQSVEHWVELTIKGNCNTALNFRDGGRLRKGEVITTGNVGTVLALGDAKQKTGPTRNNGNYVLDLWTDGGDEIGCVVEERYQSINRACNVEARVFQAASSTIDVLYRQLNPRSTIQVDVMRVPQ